jgi:hypothetical protein
VLSAYVTKSLTERKYRNHKVDLLRDLQATDFGRKVDSPLAHRFFRVIG